MVGLKLSHAANFTICFADHILMPTVRAAFAIRALLLVVVVTHRTVNARRLRKIIVVPFPHGTVDARRGARRGPRVVAVRTARTKVLPALALPPVNDSRSATQQ